MKGLFQRTVVSTTSNNWPLILQGLADLTDDQVNTLADSLKTPCPLCHRRGCYVFRGGEDGLWSCQNCGEGDGWKLLQKVNGWDFTVAVSEINSFVRRGAVKPLLGRKPRPQISSEPEPQDSIRGWIDRFNQNQTSVETLEESPASTGVRTEATPTMVQEDPPLVIKKRGRTPLPTVKDRLSTALKDDLPLPKNKSETLLRPGLVPDSSREINLPSDSPKDNRVFRRFAAQAVGQIVRDIQPTCWLIRDFLEHAALARISAPPGCCKSFLAVDIAASVATGHDFHGLAVKSGPVFYMPGNGLNDMKKRFRAWEIHNRVALEGTPLFLLPDPSDMTLIAYLEAATTEIERVIRTRNTSPQLIIIDTSAHLASQPHHTPLESMIVLASHIRAVQKRFGCCVLITGDDWDIPRSLLDAEYQLNRQEESSQIALQTLKMKDGELAAPLDMMLVPAVLGLMDEYGQPLTSAILVRTDSDPINTTSDDRKRSGKPLTQTQETVLHTINRLSVEGRATYQGVLDDIKAQGLPVSNYARTVNALVQRNLVTMAGDDLVAVTESDD
jgi:hypothetical protein